MFKNISVLVDFTKNISATVCSKRSNQLRSTNMEDLPRNNPIILIDNADGSLVYVIGVCHVSEDSRRAVKNLIRNVQPDVVLLELCEGREAFLYKDEGNLREGLAKEGLGWWSLDVVNNKKKLYVILARKLGILPGGEMKTAYDEAKKIPGTKVLLGDLPMELTEQKLDQGFSFWEKLRFAFLILILSFLSIFMTAKQMMNLVMEESNDSHSQTENGRLLLDGRDEFLTFSLQRATETWIFDEEDESFWPPTVVGVVGAAHLPGIVRNWSLVTEEDINQLLESYGCDMTNFDVNKEREV